MHQWRSPHAPLMTCIVHAKHSPMQEVHQGLATKLVQGLVCVIIRDLHGYGRNMQASQDRGRLGLQLICSV